MSTNDGKPLAPRRRALLQSTLAVAAASAAGTLFRAPGAWAQSGFDWKRFKGEKIEITLQKSPFHDVLQKYEPEFTAMTGIEVGSEQIPEQQYRQKLAIEFASGKPSFDACYVAQATQKRLFGRGKWLADLRPLIADASLTSPDLDFADFSKASIEAGTQADGRIDTLPMTFHYNILMYNKELFQKKGIAVPTIIRGAHGRRSQAQRSGQRRLRLRCARAQEREHPDLDELHARLRRRFDRQGRSAQHRRTGGDRRRRDLSEAGAGQWPGGRGRLQLVRVPGAVHAGQGGDVDRHLVRRRGDRRSRRNPAWPAAPASPS